MGGVECKGHTSDHELSVVLGLAVDDVVVDHITRPTMPGERVRFSDKQRVDRAVDV